MTGPHGVDHTGAATRSAGIIDQILRWLAIQALESTTLQPLYGGLCERIRSAGIPLDRARVTWPSFHPLTFAEEMTWDPETALFHEAYPGSRINTPEWLTSPLKHLLDSEAEFLRRRLNGPNAMVDFEQLEDLAEDGFTDYFAAKTFFSIPRIGDGTTGILASWSTRRPGGFTEGELAVLSTLQQEFAVAFRSCVQNDVMRTISQVYLGKMAAARVLSGEIQRGDGQKVDAVIWYSDLRNSTALSESIELDDYLQLLDTYFECAGGAVLEHGGEILDFVGDSVVAIFPTALGDAATRATNAAKSAHDRARSERKHQSSLPLHFGIGITAGTVMYGNFGTANRLVFSAIGPSVNEAARIEKLNKVTGTAALASRVIAEQLPDLWHPVGPHTLDGVSEPVMLYTADL